MSRDDDGRERAALYFRSPAGELLVPLPAMRVLNQCSTKTAVAKRAGQHPSIFTKWKNLLAPEVFDWVCGGPHPAGKRIHYPAWCRKGHSPGAEDFLPDEAMLACRSECSTNAICRAAAEILAGQAFHKGTNAVWKPGSRRRDAKHHSYLKLLRFGKSNGLPWWRGHLLRGEQPPADVKIASDNQVERMLGATDYVAFCREAEIKPVAFCRWFSKNIIPAGELRIPFLLFLYGAAKPDGWTIIDRRMRKLHDERTPAGICAAAGVPEHRYYKCQADGTAGALAAAIAHAGRHPNATTDRLQENPEWRGLDDSAREWMWKYAKTARLAECCARAGGINKQEIAAWLADAERHSGKAAAAELRRFLEGATTAIDGREYHRLKGVVVGGLFFPPVKMLSFRGVASTARVVNNLASLFRELPCVDQWFATVSQPTRSRTTQTCLDVHPTGGDPPNPRMQKRGLKHREWILQRRNGASIGSILLNWNDAHPEDKVTYSTIAKACKRKGKKPAS